MKIKPISLISILVIIALFLPVIAGSAKEQKATPEEKADLHYRIGQEYFNKGDYLSALRELMQAVQFDKKNADAHFLLGTTYFLLKHYPEAESGLKTALELKKDDPQGFPQANNNLGNVYIQIGKYDEAIVQFTKCLDFIFYQPKFPQAYTNLGIAYMKKGDSKKAQENFRYALKLDPNYCPAYLNLGEISAKAKQHEEAIEQYRKVLEICGNMDEYKIARLYLGLELNEVGKRSEACDQFFAIVKEAPDSELAKKAGEYIRLLRCK